MPTISDDYHVPELSGRKVRRARVCLCVCEGWEEIEGERAIKQECVKRFWFLSLAVAVIVASAVAAAASHAPLPLSLAPLLPQNRNRAQKRQLLHEQAVGAAARIADPFRCVERLLGASASELRRLAARDAASSAAAAAAASGASQLAPPPPSSAFASAAAAACTLRLGRLVAGGVLVDGPLQVDLRALAAALPPHVVACLLSGGDGFDKEKGEEEEKQGAHERVVKAEEGPPPLPPPDSPVPSSPAHGAASSVAPPASAFARWAEGLTPIRVSAPCSAAHAARALRLLAAIAHAADASPGVFAGLAEVTDDGAVVAFDAGGSDATAAAAAAARKKQKTASSAAASSAAASASKRRTNPFRVGLVDALALSVCAVASSCGDGEGEEEDGRGPRGGAPCGGGGGLLAAAASSVAADRERALAWVSLVPAALDAAFSALAPRVPDSQQGQQQQQQHQGQQHHAPPSSSYSVLEDPDARARAAALEVLSSPRASAVVPGVADAVRAGVLATRAALAAWGREARSRSSGHGPERAAALAESVAALALAAGAGLEELGKALSVPLFYAGFASRDPSMAALVRVVSEAAALARVGFEAAEHERGARQRAAAAAAAAASGCGASSAVAATPAPTLPFAARTALDLLAARGFALFVALSELSEPPFLDVIFAGGGERGEGGGDGEGEGEG